tara:strand:+ start:293593 stop:294435 length:843 start_codon:yes stop_codon:yes gene_type:complete
MLLDMRWRLETQYLDSLRYVLDHGSVETDRTGTGTMDVTGYQYRCTLQKEFPIITTKKVHYRGIAAELLWMMRGQTNIKPLQDQKIKIWDEWADSNGDLGPVYGYTWRKWNAGGPDQLKDTLTALRAKSDSRRIIVSAWNPSLLPLQALPPCHLMYFFRVKQGKYLDTHVIQRSADAFLGLPYNFASYATLAHIMAGLSGLIPDTYVHTVNSLHIYSNHMDQVKEQLSRNAITSPVPSLRIDCEMNESMDLDDFLKSVKTEDLQLQNYNHHKAIKAPVAV